MTVYIVMEQTRHEDPKVMAVLSSNKLAIKYIDYHIDEADMWSEE